MPVSYLLARRTILQALGAAALAPGLARAKGKDCFLFLASNKVVCADVDGTNLRNIYERPAPAAAAPAAPGAPRRGSGGLYDGIAIDHAKGQVYWTDMGGANADDGTITRSDIDGSNMKVIVAAGGTFTPKQMKLDVKNQKMYWSDREGMRVMRANMDGSNIEVLVQTGSGDTDRKDASRWCVGCAIDIADGYVYWTQKGGDNAGQGTIKRAPIKLLKGETPDKRSDIETLFSALPEPIDLDLDLKNKLLYWTDRGDNTVNRAPMVPAKGYNPAKRADRKILVTGLKEAIGISLDVPNNRMFYTSLGGEVGTSALDGKGAKLLLTGQGTLTGIEVMRA